MPLCCCCCRRGRDRGRNRDRNRDCDRDLPDAALLIVPGSIYTTSAERA